MQQITIETISSVESCIDYTWLIKSPSTWWCHIYSMWCTWWQQRVKWLHWQSTGIKWDTNSNKWFTAVVDSAIDHLQYLVCFIICSIYSVHCVQEKIDPLHHFVSISIITKNYEADFFYRITFDIDTQLHILYSFHSCILTLQILFVLFLPPVCKYIISAQKIQTESC